MGDKMKDRTARLQGRRKPPNSAVLALIALVTGLGAGGAGVAYWFSQDQTMSEAGQETSTSREFARQTETGLNPVLDAAFTPPETGPSKVELALRARVQELERILEEARNQSPSGSAVDTERLEQLQAELDGLTSDMKSREAEMSDLAAERDQLRRDVQRQESDLAGLEMMLDQADEQDKRQQDLERRRAEAKAISEAQINSSIDGLSGGSADGEDREYSGDEGFIRSGSKRIKPTQSRVIGAPSNTIMQGTVIEATLTTGINSELSGTLSSTVSHDIWAFDMSQVLIPRGSQVFGRYSNEVALGQRRVLVAWDRVVTPDGQVVDLEAYGSDRLGRSGLTGKVNTRFAQRFGAAALISVFNALPALASSKADNSETQVIIKNVGSDAGDVASEIVEEYLTLGPVISVDHGDVIMVMVTNDLELF